VGDELEEIAYCSELALLEELASKPTLKQHRQKKPILEPRKKY